MEEHTLQEIETGLIQKDARCITCGQPFNIGDIRCYPHEGGIKVKGYKDKQWVYMHCRNCGYDNALWKLLQQIKRREKWTSKLSAKKK